MLYYRSVGDECYPYTSGFAGEKGQCKYLEDLNCADDHVHKTTPPYRVANDERQIMKEIQDEGPVQAIITVSTAAVAFISLVVFFLLCLLLLRMLLYHKIRIRHCIGMWNHILASKRMEFLN